MLLPSHTSCITGDSEEKPVVPVHKMGQLMSKVNTRSNRKNWVENVVNKDECIPRLVRNTGQPRLRGPETHGVRKHLLLSPRNPGASHPIPLSVR